ncbi:uncharacterized protein LOC128572629 [Nycticebus coucang]|uniref:uncharacterized protein LOC128572629 n=1 Tax=Nycticebus coucang TaxID=9470 RepID=UPI00234DB585|nr:uncharacterized protein LOC128572629 [Nycticebus coucang]
MNSTCTAVPKLPEPYASTQNFGTVGGLNSASMSEKNSCNLQMKLNTSGNEQFLDNSFDQLKRRLELDIDSLQKENCPYIITGIAEQERQHLSEKRYSKGSIFINKNKMLATNSKESEEILKNKMSAFEEMRKRLEEQHAQQLSLLIAEQEREQERLQKEIEEQEKILEDIIPRYGIPKVLGSDNGPAFVAQVSQGMAKILGYKWKLPCAYRPQSSGQVERMNRTLKEVLTKLSVETGITDWTVLLPYALFQTKSPRNNTERNLEPIAGSNTWDIPELSIEQALARASGPPARIQHGLPGSMDNPQPLNGLAGDPINSSVHNGAVKPPVTPIGIPPHDSWITAPPARGLGYVFRNAVTAETAQLPHLRVG